MADQVLETLVTRFTADLTPLEAGFTQADREAKQAGQRIGQSLGQGLKANLGGTETRGLGTQAGQEFGEGFKVGADGRLRDAKGKFVKTGKELGEGLTDGMAQGVREGGRGLDSAVNSVTASLGGGAGGGLTGGFARLTAGAGGLSGGLTSIVGALGPVAAGITTVTTAVLASVAAVNRATNEYAKFEKGLAQVSTLTDKVPGQMGETGRAVLNLSTELGMTFQDLNMGLADILGAGVKGTEDMGAALAFLKDASKLATAGVVDTAVATDALTSVMNAYKMDASQTKKVSDEMFAAVRDGKMTFENLAGSIGMVTAIAADAKVPLQTVLAALATMTANGVQASSSVDYLRSLISAITGPSDAAAKTAKRLGIEFNYQALEAKGLVGVLQDVMRATNGDKAAMNDLFGGVEAVTAATSIASGNFERMTTNLKNQATAAGTTETAYQKMAGTLSKENDKVSANWSKLMVNLGEAFAPFKTSVLQGINEMLEGINKMLERWNLAKTITGAGNRVLDLERQIDLKRDTIQRGEAQLKDPAFANYSEAGKAEIRRRIDEAKLEVARLEAELTTARATANAVRGEQARYNVANSSALLPKGVQGPNMGGAPGAPTTVVVRGEDLQTLMGLGGKRTGTPYGQGYSFTKADGSVYSGTHNGEDIFAPKGTNVLAPFTGMLTARWSETTGNVIEMIDAAGNKLLLGHLDKYAAGLEAAIKKAGGSLLVQQGQLIAHVGNTGNLTGRGDGNSHIHMMAYDKSGRIVNPLGTNFTAMQGDAYFTGSSVKGNAAGLPKDTAPGSTTDTDDKAAKNRAAIQKEIDASVAKGKVDAAQRALAELKRLQAEELDAAKDNATKRAQVIAQTGPQIIAAEARIARAVRDQAVQAAGQWAKEQLAKEGADKAKIEAERVRRVREAYAVEAQATKQAQSEQARAQSAADDSRNKEAQQQAARINEAIRQGKIESARTELTRLQEMRTNDLRNADENAQKVAQVEQRYAALTYNAKAAIALKEKQDRDADIKNDTSLNGTTRAQALKNSNQTYLNALKAAGNERRAALDGVNKDLEASAARNAAVMPGLMSGWIDDWAQDQSKDRDAAAAGAAVVDKLFAGAIEQLGKSRAEMEAALTDALNDIYQKAIDAGIDPFSGGSPDQFRDMTTPGRSGLAALIGGNPAGFLKAFTAMGGTPDALLAEFADADWESLGLDVLQGLADGMRSDAAWDGVRGVVEGALGRILAESAFAADIAALVSDRDGTLGAPAGIVTGNERPEGESTPLAQSIALKKAVDDYAASLREMREDQLAAAEAEAIAADNADFYNAVLAERARRLQEQKDKAEAAAKAERDLADAIAKKQADAIAQATQDTADYNAAQDALAKSARDLGVAMGQTDAPYQNQIDGLEELKGKMPKMADEIDALIAKWKELQSTMQAADMAGQIAGAVSQIGALFDKVNGSEGKGALSILGDWMQMNVTAYKQFQSGDVVGAVMTTINGVLNIGESIAELNSGLKEWKKNLREIAEEQKKVLGMGTGGFKSPWEDALKKDAGNREQLANSKWYQRLWWGLTGGGPQAISDEAAKLLTDLQEIFAQLGDGIADAFTDAMLSAFEAGDMSQFADNFSKQFDAVVGKVVLKTMIEAALTQGAVADDLAALTKAIQEQRFGDVPPILASIKQKAGQIGAGIAAVAPSLPGYGSGADGGADGPDNRALFGNAPTAQLGIPRFEVTLPDTVMKPLGDFAAVIPAFSRATDRLYEAADMIVRSGWGLQKPTGLGPL